MKIPTRPHQTYFQVGFSTKFVSLRILRNWLRNEFCCFAKEVVLFREICLSYYFLLFRFVSLPFQFHKTMRNELSLPFEVSRKNEHNILLLNYYAMRAKLSRNLHVLVFRETLEKGQNPIDRFFAILFSILWKRNARWASNTIQYV